MTSADLVLLDGNIITMNPKMPLAQAIAVKGNRISCVGSNQKVRQHIGKKTKIIYLDNKTVIPGFIDTHIHVVDYGRILTWMNLEKVSSIKEIQIHLAKCIKYVDESKWILGRALNPEVLLEKRLPTCQELDTVAPDNPVVFYCQSGQVCVVNSKALETAKISQQNDSGIDRTSTGELTGVLRDQATNFVWNIIPKPTQQELYEATKLALDNCIRVGITSIHWIVLSEVELPIIQKLVETNSLPLRVYLIVPVELLDLALQNLKQLKNDYFTLGGAIIFADGYLASRTAALLEPYSDSLTEGNLLYAPNEMLTLANKIQRAGLQIIIHAVGDRANQEVLNTLQHVNRNSAVPRPRIEQAAILNNYLMHNIKELDISVSVQPCVIDSEFSVWSAKEHLGKKRAHWLFPIKDLLNHGVLISAGSDCPMEPLNPLIGIKTAVNRDGLQKTSVLDALQMYTAFAAQAASEFVNKGSIEQNKLADLTVLSNNPISVITDELNSISICFTVINGVVCCSEN
jgi:predicted amidohydrolase YtcJ